MGVRAIWVMGNHPIPNTLFLHWLQHWSWDKSLSSMHNKIWPNTVNTLCSNITMQHNLYSLPNFPIKAANPNVSNIHKNAITVSVGTPKAQTSCCIQLHFSIKGTTMSISYIHYKIWQPYMYCEILEHRHQLYTVTLHDKGHHYLHTLYPQYNLTTILRILREQALPVYSYTPW